jgi:hypothetical protein
MASVTPPLGDEVERQADEVCKVRIGRVIG